MDVESLRKLFPILDQRVNDHPLVYLDNAATTQKPNEVIDSIVDYYKTYNSNVHRGVHYLSAKATNIMEEARNQLKTFIGAKNREEVIFTSGTTHGINLVAQTYARKNLSEGDEVILSVLEHHSNIVPWQMICEEKGAEIKIIPVNEKGELVLSAYENLLSKKTRIVAINHVSNTLGTINPIKQIVELAHRYGAVVLVDGAQAMGHLKVDVQDLDCDFYSISAHKMYGPTGIGSLYGKEEFLNDMPPYMGGGEMIKTVTFDKTSFNELPYKFEAGTPPVAEIVGFGACLRFWNRLDRKKIEAHEAELLDYATKELKSIPGMMIYGDNNHKISIVSFNVEDIHPYDLGTLLDQMGIAVRTGHHCTEPLMDFFNIPGTVRASFGMYNTKEEVDILISGIRRALKMIQ